MKTAPAVSFSALKLCALLAAAFLAAPGSSSAATSALAAQSLLDPSVANNYSNASSASLFITMGSHTYFLTGDSTGGTHNIGLWVTDGSSGTTSLVKDLGVVGAVNNNLVTTGSKLYFTAAGDVWASDGTTAGTTMVPLATGSRPTGLETLGTDLYFTADTSGATRSSTFQIHKVTSAGTLSVATALATGSGFTQGSLTAVNGYLFFSSGSGTGTELFRYDPTNGNVVKLTTLGNSISSLTPFGTTIFFTAGDTGDLLSGNAQLHWFRIEYDGTNLINLTPNLQFAGGSNIILKSGGNYFWVMSDNSATDRGNQLWKSNGTAVKGATKFSDQDNAIRSLVGTPMTLCNNKIYFAGNFGGTTGSELGVIDPADSTGTDSVVKDINAGAGNSTPANLLTLGSKMYFTASATASNISLFQSDGTSGGTIQIPDINTAGSDAPVGNTLIGNLVYFRAQTASSPATNQRVPMNLVNLSVAQGDGQTAGVSTAFPTALQINVKDTAGTNNLAGVAVTFVPPGSGAGGSFASSATVSTNASGIATAPTFTANATTGSYTVKVLLSGIDTGVTFSLTNGVAVNTAPVVVSPTQSGITGSSAILGGNVSSNGGAAITKRGILYSLASLNGNPTLGGSNVLEADDASNTTGAFTKTVSSLTAGSAYVFVAFASNSVGTTYTSPVSTFTTLSSNANLSALTTTAGSISFNSATTSYALSVPFSTAAVTVTPTKADSGASIQVQVNSGGYASVTSGSASGNLSLNVGTNPIDIKVTAQDNATTKTYTITVTRSPNTVFTTGVDAPPGAAGTAFDSIRTGSVISSPGALAFRGFLAMGGTVNANNYMGIWKSPSATVASTVLVARSGSTAPESASAVFDILPVNPTLNNNGQTSFPAMLRVNTGSPLVTMDTDTGVWSEIDGTGLRLILREGDAITGGTAGAIAPTTWVATGNASVAFSVQMTPTGSAIVRSTASGGTLSLATIALEGGAAPAIGGGTSSTFGVLYGNSSDPRLDAAGDLAFLGSLADGKTGIWYQAASGSLVAVMKSGTPPPGLAANAEQFERPTLGNATTVAFRVITTTSQAIYKGNPATPASMAAVTVSGYTNAQIPSVPAGSQVWSLWSPFSNASGHLAYRISLKDGSNIETRAILTDTNGTPTVIAKVGDTAPGTSGDTFVNFDHPIIGDGDQAAFTASTAGGVVGLWCQAAGGGALSLKVKVGDTFIINAVTETVSAITVPGTTTADRTFETRAMDAAGHIVVQLSYASGKTGLLLTGP